MRPQRRRRPPQAPVNQWVKAARLTVISETGEKLGEFSKQEALDLAGEKGLDLLQITFDKEPCVAKILDYGKHKFDMKKKQSAAKKKQQKIEQKEIKMRPNIDIGDIKVKAKRINGFLLEGHKVKLIMQVRGREQGMKDFCYQKYENFVTFIDKFEYDTKPKWQGNKVLAILKKSASI